MYVPYLMLRNLGPQAMTPAEQRRADEQLGQLAAALARATRSLTTRTQAVSGLPAGLYGHSKASVRPAPATPGRPPLARRFRIGVRASPGHYDR